MSTPAGVREQLRQLAAARAQAVPTLAALRAELRLLETARRSVHIPPTDSRESFLAMAELWDLEVEVLLAIPRASDVVRPRDADLLLAMTSAAAAEHAAARAQTCRQLADSRPIRRTRE